MPGSGPGMAPGMGSGPGPVPPGPDMPNSDGAKTITGGSTDKGTLHESPNGNGRFITVTSRTRFAVGATSEEKRPQEYAPMIDQYMKNLADQDTAASR